ncbi:MAG: hypothetical protein R3D70_09270 [Rhizobiaceae bacterium]
MSEELYVQWVSVWVDMIAAVLLFITILIGLWATNLVRKSNQIAETNMKVGSRAYLGITGKQSGAYREKGSAHLAYAEIKWNVVNSGKTPAIDIDMAWCIVILPYESDGVPELEGLRFRIRDIGAETNYTVRNTTLNIHLLDRSFSRACDVYVYCLVTYRDVFSGQDQIHEAEEVVHIQVDINTAEWEFDKTPNFTRVPTDPAIALRVARIGRPYVRSLIPFSSSPNDDEDHPVGIRS